MAFAALPLVGCDSLERAFGLEKVVPDEFAVVSRAPLAIPPDYALRPPRPGAEPTQDVSPTDQAKQTIFRAGDEQAELPGADQRSAGENELLKQAGAASAQPDIRQTIAQEAKADTSPIDRSFVDKLLFWRGPDTPAAPADQVIDPHQEAFRLKGSQAAANAPATAPGLTSAPLIERTRAPSMVSAF
ncbi:MAG TPA: DUF3035 domain-containing protein [Stellaceae bacterium]|nr:DUF3035 domain-containing protein [Stellaceae bacterium]